MSPPDPRDVATILGYVNDIPTGSQSCQWLGEQRHLKSYDVVSRGEPSCEPHVRAQLWLRLVGLLPFSCQETEEWKRSYHNRIRISSDLCKFLVGDLDPYRKGWKSPPVPMDPNRRPSWVLVPTVSTLLDAIAVLEVFCSMEEKTLLENWPEKGRPDWTPNMSWALANWGRHMTVGDENVNIFEYEIIYCQHPDDIDQDQLSLLGVEAVKQRRPEWPIPLIPALPTRYAPLDLVAVTLRAMLRLQRPEEDATVCKKRDPTWRREENPPAKPSISPELTVRSRLMWYFLNLYDQGYPTEWREVRPNGEIPFPVPDPPCTPYLRKLEWVRRVWCKPSFEPSEPPPSPQEWPSYDDVQHLVDYVGSSQAVKKFTAARELRFNVCFYIPPSGDQTIELLMKGLHDFRNPSFASLLEELEEYFHDDDDAPKHLDDDDVTPKASPVPTPKAPVCRSPSSMSSEELADWFIERLDAAWRFPPRE